VNNPDAAIAFLHSLKLPMWHVRNKLGDAQAINPDSQGEGFLREMLTRRETFKVLHEWLPIHHFGHEWPATTLASLFSWAITRAPTFQDWRGPLPDKVIEHEGYTWRLHPIRFASQSEVMARAYSIAAQTPLATAWDPLAGVPLPGSGGTHVVE
jgi:hypothetical protein